jgi:outer membrane protein OmpA-like peptidoglycan-associated protein
VNTTSHQKASLAAIAAFLFLGACSPALVKPDGAEDVRVKLSKLQSDPQLASRAPVAIKDAEAAVAAAQVPNEDANVSRHLVVIADRKVDIATAQAHTRLLEDQRTTLSEQRETARLDSRTREADAAKGSADAARMDADAARRQAAVANQMTAAATQQAMELQTQIAELSAKETERGLIVTLGDVLFATGRSELQGSASSNLGKLASFLNRYPERTVAIEGYTDSVGGDRYNQDLSQKRADSVKAYLMQQGIASGRITSSGMGEGSPVAGNDSATGRQQNRRVEVVISQLPGK